MGTLLALLLLQTPVEIETAVRKGLEAVKNGEGDLALWTLAYAGVPVDGFRPRLEAALKDLPSTTTSAALLAMTLERLHRAKYQLPIAYCAQQLIDTQCRDGLWDAGKSVEMPEIALPPFPRPRVPRRFGQPENPEVTRKQKLLRRAEGGEKGDLTRARWALWGLLAGERSGLIPPAEVVEKASAAIRKGGGDAADVVSCLCVCDYLTGKDWRKDPDVLKAVERLAAENRTEPGSIYVLDRAMIHFNSETLGGVAWFPRVTKILLAAQKPDGSWGSLEDTCYATLTLHKPLLILHDPARK